jgi:hypothetical protein
MSEPKRMLEGLSGGELHDLLEAGKSEMPSDRQLLGLAAKIGIVGGLGGLGGAGVAGLGGGGAAGGAGAGAAGASASAAPAAAGAGAKVAVATGAAKVGIAVKVAGAITIASAVGVGAVAVSHREASPPAPVGMVATETASVAAAAPSSSPATTKLAIAEPPPSVEPSATATTSAKVATKSSAKPAASDTGMEAEVRLLERAQDALRSRSPSEALALADEHARRFPQGILVQEREVIAVEALVKAGRRDEAKARAARFRARFPGSSHTRRLDALVGE